MALALQHRGLAVEVAVRRWALVLLLLVVAVVGGAAMAQVAAAVVLAAQAILAVGGMDFLYQAQTLF